MALLRECECILYACQNTHRAVTTSKFVTYTVSITPILPLEDFSLACPEELDLVIEMFDFVMALVGYVKCLVRSFLWGVLLFELPIYTLPVRVSLTAAPWFAMSYT